MPGGLTVAVPGTTHIGSPNQPQTVTVAVPDGTTPSSIHVKLTDPVNVAVVAHVTVGSRVAGEVSLRALQSKTLDLNAMASDVSHGALTLIFSVELPPQTSIGGCGTEATSSDLTAQADVSDLVVSVSGEETLPKTVAAFFPQTTPRVTVLVPTAATSDVLAAGLAAVASASYRYADADVTMATTAPADHLLGERIIRVQSGTGAAKASIDRTATVPTLALTGHGAALEKAASALGADELQLANGATATGLSAPPTKIKAPVNLAGFGADRLTLSGLGTSSAYVGVRQADFGHPVSSLQFHLDGTHSALPSGMSAVLNVYWNDALIGSQDLTKSNDVGLDLNVPSSLMQGANGLRLETSVGASRSCDYAAVPFTLTIDGIRSTVASTAGDGDVTGFQRFPQVLGGELPVALRGTGAEQVTNAELAAGVVATLQRASTSRLQVSLIDPDTLLSSTESGLLCGATGADTDKVQARLRFYGMQLMYTASQQTKVGTNRPYASLEEVHQGNRDLLLLGGWAPNGGSSDNLATSAVDYVQTTTWSGLSDDVLISNDALPPFTLPSTAIYPQSVVVAESRHHVSWLWIGLGVLVVLALARWLAVRWRRRRIRAYVDAQQRSESGPPDK